jgi:hypothetical protein
MEKNILVELNRINELMGLNLLMEAPVNPFVSLIRNAARGLENEVSVILGRTINNMDELTEKDIPYLLKSKNKALRSLSTKAWGISQQEFANKTFDELTQELAGRGLPKSQINRFIKNAVEDFGEPKGGLPQKPISAGNTGPRGNTGGAASNTNDVVNDVFDDVELDLNRISRNQSSLSPEQQDFFEMISKLLKKHRLPKISEKELDDLIQNARALMNKAAGGQLQDAFNNLNSITRKLERMTTAEQKQFLKQLIRETNANPTMAKMFKNYFVPWSDSRWSTDFMKTWKDSMTITRYMLFASLAVDTVRGLYDFATDREFKGHLGTEYPASVAIKAAAAAIPYVNILTSAAFFLETVVRTVKGDKPKPVEGGGAAQGSTPDSRFEMAMNLSQAEAKKYVEDDNKLESALGQPLTDFNTIEYKPIVGEDGKTKIQIWLDGSNKATLEKVRSYPLGPGQIKLLR